MNRTDNEIVVFFKENENDIYKLKSIYTELVKSQRYYLAKLYKNKIEILEHLEKFETENNLKRYITSLLIINIYWITVKKKSRHIVDI